MNNNILQQEVCIDHDSHVYTDIQGNEYLSTTRFIGQFKEEVNFNRLAEMVAKKREKAFKLLAEERHTTIERIALTQPKYERGHTKKLVQAEWDAKRDEATEYGSWIHDKLELAGTTGKIYMDDGYSNYYRWFINNYSMFKKKYYEQVVYYRCDDFRIAGTMDYSFFRKGPKSMFCIRDFKTNDYTTTTHKKDSMTGQWKNYDRQLTGVLSHLEDTDYIKYCLQQSIYAYMCEQTLGFKIGNLAIIGMPWKNKVETPVLQYIPYMKHEVEMMIAHYISKQKKAYVLDADNLNKEDYYDQIII